MKPAALLAFLFLSCGTETSNGPDIDMIRERLNENACGIVREDLIFRIEDLEFINDTTFTEIPLDLIAESLTVCPVTGEQLQMIVENRDRSIICPSGHGQTEF